MHSHELVSGLPPVLSILPLFERCFHGKHAKTPYPIDPTIQANTILRALHT
jgi:hypothetical protein